MGAGRAEVARRCRRVAAAILLAAGSLGASYAGEIRFREVSSAWNLDFRHHHGGSGERYMVETMVGGVVLFDYDGDGDVDVFFVDGGRLPGYEGDAPRSRLLRNEGPGRFVDVTALAGIEFGGYGCGGAAGDIDGDGDVDLYLTALGTNALYRNEGDGSFREVAQEAGVAESMWSASAAFADLDRDDDLDLYVVNYVDFGVDNHKFCGDAERGVQGYCQPGVYNGEPDRLYLNGGDGTFVKAGAAGGLGVDRQAGLGVVVGDLDGDGWEDVYVANDLDPNLLLLNRGDGSFEDVSLLSGTAYSDTGAAEAGMGVEMADLDGDGQLDLVVTNFALETNALYKNLGGGLFVDQRFPSSLAEPSLLKLGFGVVAADLDHDGDLDLAVANGHILDNAEELSGVREYAQRNQVFENLGAGRFREVPANGMDEVRVSRGMAAGDLDGDGDLDLVIVNSNQVAEAYENLSGSSAGGWLQVDLEAPGGNRHGIGARAVAVTDGGEQLRHVRTTSSYLSQNALTLHWGLGAENHVDELRIQWPDGRRQLLKSLPAGRRLRLTPPLGPQE